MKAKANEGLRWRRLLPAGVVGLVVLGVGGVWLTRTAALAKSTAGVPTFVVQRGPLTISVVESGTISSQEQISLKNEVEGQTTLIYLIPEGTRVKQGELLVELDASKLQDDRVEQQIRVENANAEWIRARENLAVVKNQSDSDISKAELTYDFALEDVRKYEEGEYPQEVRQADSKITIAREEKERAAEKLRWSQQLFEEKYISQTELQADDLAHKRAQLDYELAVAAKELLENYTHERQIEQLDSDVDQADLALERTRLKANADIVQAEAQLRAKEAELEQQESKLAKIGEQIDKSKIYASRDGLVVYATSTQSRGRRGMTQPLEEGQTVRERQELIYLPSTEQMMAELLVHESSLEKVQVGQPVYVTVDALPGRTFVGRVRFIAPLPDASSMFMNPDLKVYNTRVHLDGNNPELRTGMSCRAEILVAQYDDALYAPAQAVVRNPGGQPLVYVQENGKYVARPIEIGLDNSSMVHVRSGLAQGEVVNLAPPLDPGALPFTSAAAGLTRAPTSAPAPLPAEPPDDGGLRAGVARPPGFGEGEAGGPGMGGPGAGGTGRAGGEGFGRGPGFGQQLSDEERAAWRARIQNMTPEEREQFAERMRERRSSGGGAGEARPAGEDERSSGRGAPAAGPGGTAERGAERAGGDSPPGTTP